MPRASRRPDWLAAGPAEGSVSALFRSSTRLKNDPAAKPAGFQYAADASSATATNAPPMPAARVPTASNDWAPAGATVAVTINPTTISRSISLIQQSLAYEPRVARTQWNQRLNRKHPG